MNGILRVLTSIAFAALPLVPGTLLAQQSPASQILPEGIRGGSETVPEPRVDIRNYLFAPTNEELPYSVFVSSKVKPGEKAPLIIALRGFTGTTLTFVRGTAVDLAEQGGYILVAPIGYNNRSGFGVAPRSVTPPPPRPDAAPAQMPPFVGGSTEKDPSKASQYSEQDVMNVLAAVRKEFAVDDRRIYLMGHSQGGGGARHLAAKYPDIWAAVALIAPAVFEDATPADGKVPMLMAIGDKDFLIDRATKFHEQLGALNIQHEYVLKPGLDHGQIIMSAMPEAFEFFHRHAKLK